MSTSEKITCTELTTKITEHIEQLAKATDAARTSEEMLRYLEAVSHFHQYSMNNIFLILMAKHDATQVAGFQAWKKLGRYVCKGEHGIAILAPVIINKEEDHISGLQNELIQNSNSEKFLVGFKVVYVFDISQTEGEPLPEPPEWKSPEKNELLSQELIQFAESRGIMVSEQELRGNVQGVSKGGAILLSPGAGTLTLIHEIAHELLHRAEDRPSVSNIRELEAEAVAFSVGRYFGLEVSSCTSYLILHNISSKEIMEHLERVQKAVVQIITTVEPSLQKISAE